MCIMKKDYGVEAERKPFSVYDIDTTQSPGVSAPLQDKQTHFQLHLQICTISTRILTLGSDGQDNQQLKTDPPDNHHPEQTQWPREHQEGSDHNKIKSATNKPNMTGRERQALVQPNTTITRRNDGGKTVTKHMEDLHQLCLPHLNDNPTYKQLMKNTTCTTRLKINKMLYILCRHNFYPTLSIKYNHWL